MPDAIVTAPGSLGDVNPLLAIARELKAAGMEVVFSAAERYLDLARRAGLQVHVLTSEETFSALVSNPDIWKPRQGTRIILRDAVRETLEPHYRWLERTCRPGRTLLVSHALDFSGRIFRDRHPNTAMATVILAPALLRSKTAPPRLSGYRWERWVPPAAMPLVYRCADWWIDRAAAGPINAFRMSLGLPPVRRLLNRWWFSPDMVLGMFPAWFSVPPAELPANFHHTGFPLADSAELLDSSVGTEMKEILARLGPERPVVFAPGTAHHHARPFLEKAVQSCLALGRPGILLSTDSGQFPGQLPETVVAAKYLPFSALLPRAAAIVHHGGVGTTSQAMAAGVPQVVLPMAFDQFDNAERVGRLGCGNWIPMQKMTARRLTGLLQSAGGSEAGRHETADRMQSAGAGAASLAARLLLRLAGRKETDS